MLRGLRERVQGPGPPQRRSSSRCSSSSSTGSARTCRSRWSTSAIIERALDQQGGQGVLRFINLFSGGALSRLAVFVARHHALHHGLDHHAAPAGGHPQARAVAEGGRERPEEDQPDDALRDGRAGAAPVHRTGVRVPQRRRSACPTSSRRRVHGAAGWPHRPDADRRHRAHHVDGRAHHPARASATGCRS